MCLSKKYSFRCGMKQTARLISEDDFLSGYDHQPFSLSEVEDYRKHLKMAESDETANSTDVEEQLPSASDFPLEVYNDLLCPICLEFFKHPIILPCSHVLCRAPCAEHLFDFNFIRCPVCRENCYISGGIGSLPRVIALESIIEKYRLERRKVIQSAAKRDQCRVRKTSATSDNGCGGIGVCGTPAVGLGVEPSSSEIGACSIRALGRTDSASDSDSQRQRTRSRHVPSSALFDDARERSESTCIPRLGEEISPGSGTVSETLSSGRLVLPVSRPPVVSAIAHCSPRSADVLDTSLFDVSVDSVTSCSRHGPESSLYCHVCERCVCDVCGDADHVTSHETNTIDDAANQVKSNLSVNAEQMANGRTKLVASLQQQRQKLKDMEQLFGRKREEVDMQCDSLLAEVEHNRSLFLADLEQEERTRQSELEDVIGVFEKVLDVSQSLSLYANELLEKDCSTVLQVSPALNERILGSILDCEACLVQPTDLQLQDKVVDLRKEQALLRDVHYLNPPATPTIDLARCARSENTVALFLIPTRGSDVVDTYVIRYCSEEQKNLGMEETLTFHNGQSDHLLTPSGQNSPPSLSYVAVLDNLMAGTTYMFCATAANRAGHSANSQVVQCVTLTQTESVVPVPVILEAMCKTYTSSIRVFTPSPHDVAPEQSISHFLLYRPRDRKLLWRSVALCGRPEHRVFGLEPETQYDFIVMATNPRGECQMSEKVVLETERSG